ncbi:hypothetical protein [Wolbachia endosymbiont of Ctenocephalides felis wCfeT]|uniref:hypothetical protein n=1 Tax=Wolbachia endosymbiont of Ctenocephalides felis wCfeT TaxID=2732593 RepID=UPI001445F96F|nr:hypothetical protein [Wolbachia endosymbiont of Ctenocephalides felis wCfeT]
MLDIFICTLHNGKFRYTLCELPIKKLTVDANGSIIITGTSCHIIDKNLKEYKGLSSAIVVIEDNSGNEYEFTGKITGYDCNSGVLHAHGENIKITKNRKLLIYQDELSFKNVKLTIMDNNNFAEFSKHTTKNSRCLYYAFAPAIVLLGLLGVALYTVQPEIVGIALIVCSAACLIFGIAMICRKTSEGKQPETDISEIKAIASQGNA